MNNQTIYQIALTLVRGIGDINGKKLVAYCGGAEAVFCESRKALLAIPGMRESIVDSIFSIEVMRRAEKEANYIEKNDIETFFFQDSAYPRRLLHCPDSPMMLYSKGFCDFNAKKVIGIVGTRNMSDYGREQTEKIVAEFKSDNVLIVSGLAYGVDTAAHRAAIVNGIDTVAVLGHGLQTIYPETNASLAKKIIHQGALVTEYISGTQPDRDNFPRRNRIVAGMTDCLIVIESALKGGALITADIAASYNRDIFAIPGRVGDIYSEGCNHIIKVNKAALVTCADDIRYAMRWDIDTNTPSKQMKLFREFNQEEQQIMDCFGDEDIIHLDKIINQTGFTSPRIASVLLSLEFDGVISALPGKRYAKSTVPGKK